MLKRFNKIKNRVKKQPKLKKTNAQEEIMNLDVAEGTMAEEITLAPLERQSSLSKNDEVTRSAVFDNEEVRKF